MIGVTDRFLDAVSGRSYTRVSRGYVLIGGVLQDITLSIDDGKITVDSSQPQRITGSVVLRDPTGTLVPTDVTSLLAPKGRKIQLWSGIRWAPDDEELVPVATLAFDTVTTTEDDQGIRIEISGFDSSKIIERAGWAEPYPIDPTFNVGQAIARVVNIAYPGLSLAFESAGPLVGAQILGIGSADPWAECQRLAAAAGYEVFVDATDVVQLQPVPDPDSAPVFRVVERAADGTGGNLLTIAPVKSTGQTYDRIVATGDGGYTAGTTARAGVRVVVVADGATEPYSTKAINSPLYTSPEVAAEAARAELNRWKGSTERVTGTMLPNPALRGGEVIRIERPRIGISASYILDGFTLGFAEGQAMDFSARERRVA